MCSVLRQSISSQVMQTLASLLLHYDHIPTAHLALKYAFIYWRESNSFVEFLFTLCTFPYRGHAVGSWLRHCATRRKVAVSIPDCVIGIFHERSPSGHTVSTSKRNEYQKYFQGDIGGRCVVLTTFVLKSGSLSLLEPSGMSKPVQEFLCLYIYLATSKA